MALVAGQRTLGSTRARRAMGLVARRLLAGSALLALAGALALGLHGWIQLVGLVVAIPGAFTLAAARNPWVADCPGCGHLLGARTLALPDEPVVGRGSTDVRCPACGIYVDSLDGEVREVPFNRLLDAPDYTVVMEAAALADLTWGVACVRCGRRAACGLALGHGPAGVLSVEGAEMVAIGSVVGSGIGSAVGLRVVPFCDHHGGDAEQASRAVIVARTGLRATVQFRLYAAYRAFLDANRERLDLEVRSFPGGIDAGGGRGAARTDAPVPGSAQGDPTEKPGG